MNYPPSMKPGQNTSNVYITTSWLFSRTQQVLTFNFTVPDAKAAHAQCTLSPLYLGAAELRAAGIGEERAHACANFYLGSMLAPVG